MMGFIFGIFVGIVLAETGCLPILQEYFSELFTAINNLKGDSFEKKVKRHNYVQHTNRQLRLG